jgi:hypothetical protein
LDLEPEKEVDRAEVRDFDMLGKVSFEVFDELEAVGNGGEIVNVDRYDENLTIFVQEEYRPINFAPTHSKFHENLAQLLVPAPPTLLQTIQRLQQLQDELVARALLKSWGVVACR